MTEVNWETLEPEENKRHKGKVDEHVIAGYVAGTCTPKERILMERAMRDDKDLRECVAIVKAVCPNGTMLSAEEIDALDFRKIKLEARRGGGPAL